MLIFPNVGVGIVQFLLLERHNTGWKLLKPEI